ncbi:MAG: hypothetical protein Q9174_004471 [Haloplaca sp. 1 TL-2023]
MEQQAMSHDGSSAEFNREDLKKLQTKDLVGVFDMTFEKLEDPSVRSKHSPSLEEIDKSIVRSDISMMKLAREVCVWNLLYDFILSEETDTKKEKGLLLEHLYKIEHTTVEDWGDTFADALLDGNWTLDI